jgi:tRNA(adenine34) deaminase
MPAANRSSKKQSSSRAQQRSPNKRGNKRWVAGVKTVSTFPPKGLFTKDAHTIAKSLASKKVSPKGPGSGMRMLTYFINRAGRGLSPSRRKVLERAKRILSQQAERQKTHERPRAA